MKRKLLALTLALVLALGVLPAAGLARSADDYPIFYSNVNPRGVSNGPNYYPDYENDDGDVLVQAISTYHYNYGSGKAPGTIAIYDWDSDEKLGEWNAEGRAGNKWWDVYPDFVLEKGRAYYFVDSDPESWAYNAESGNEGFIELRGVVNYTGGTPAPTPTPTPTPAPGGVGKHSAWLEKPGEDGKSDLDVLTENDLIPPYFEQKDLTVKVTRAEFAAAAVRLYETLTGAAAPNGGTPFTDIFNHPLAYEIGQAYTVGVTNGTNTAQTLFSPDDTLTREQMATMLHRVIKKFLWPDYALAADKSYPLPAQGYTPFDDDGSISAWAKEAVYYMAALRIVNGVGKIEGVGANCFGPRNLTDAQRAKDSYAATREQALAMSGRTFKNRDAILSAKPGGSGSTGTDVPSAQAPVPNGVTGTAKDNRLSYETANVVFGSGGSGTATLTRSADGEIDPGSRAAAIYDVALDELPADAVTFAFDLPAPAEGRHYAVLCGVPVVNEAGTPGLTWQRLETEYADGTARADVYLDGFDTLFAAMDYDTPQEIKRIHNHRGDSGASHFYVTVGEEYWMSDDLGKVMLVMPKDFYHAPPADGVRRAEFSDKDAMLLLGDLDRILAFYEADFKLVRSEWPLMVYIQDFNCVEKFFAGGEQPHAAFTIPWPVLGGTAFGKEAIDFGYIQVNPARLSKGYRVDTDAAYRYSDQDVKTYGTLAHELFHFIQRNYYNKLLWIDESSASFLEAMLAVSDFRKSPENAGAWLDPNYVDAGIVQFELYPAMPDIGTDSSYAHLPLMHYLSRKGGYPDAFRTLFELLRSSDATDTGAAGIAGVGSVVVRNMDWQYYLCSAAGMTSSAENMAALVTDYYRELVTKGALYAVNNKPWEIHAAISGFDLAGYQAKKKADELASYWEWTLVGDKAELAGEAEDDVTMPMTPYAARFLVLDGAKMPAEAMAMRVKLGTEGVNATLYEIGGTSYDKLTYTEIGEKKDAGCVVRRDGKYLLMLVNTRNANVDAEVEMTFTEVGAMRVLREKALWVNWDDISFSALPTANVRPDFKNRTLTVDLPSCYVTEPNSDGFGDFTRSALHLTGDIAEETDRVTYVLYTGTFTGSYSYSFRQVIDKSGAFSCSSVADPEPDEISNFELRVYTDGHTQLSMDIYTLWEYEDTLGHPWSYVGLDEFEISDSPEMR